jgi:hypothetical protein
VSYAGPDALAASGPRHWRTRPPETGGAFETVLYAIVRGMEVGKELRSAGKMDEEAKKILFGQTAKTTG